MGTYLLKHYFSTSYTKRGHIMKTDIICVVPVTAGELTIVMADYAGDVMKHCCDVARSARDGGAGVLVINTRLSKRRFKEAATEAGIEVSPVRDTNAMISPGTVPLIIQTSLAGELSSQLGEIRHICEEAKIRIVVITGWEWTSSSYRRKEQLLFGIRGLLDELDIALVVYSQSPSRIECGKYARGGVGKLAMIAYDVLDIEAVKGLSQEETDLGEFVATPKPQPVFAG